MKSVPILIDKRLKIPLLKLSKKLSKESKMSKWSPYVLLDIMVDMDITVMDMADMVVMAVMVNTAKRLLKQQLTTHPLSHPSTFPLSHPS